MTAPQEPLAQAVGQQVLQGQTELREVLGQMVQLELLDQEPLEVRAQLVLVQAELRELRVILELQVLQGLVYMDRLVLLAWLALAELLDSLVDLEQLDQVPLELRD